MENMQYLLHQLMGSVAATHTCTLLKYKLKPRSLKNILDQVFKIWLICKWYYLTCQTIKMLIQTPNTPMKVTGSITNSVYIGSLYFPIQLFSQGSAQRIYIQGLLKRYYIMYMHIGYTSVQYIYGQHIKFYHPNRLL